MPITSYQRSCPIAALATADDAAAIAVIRCSGSGSFQNLQVLFSRPEALRDEHSHWAQLGWLTVGNERIDQILLLPFAKGKSYTGEESVELHCHGGTAVVERVLQLLFQHGFQPALPGEFSYRAFVNGQMDLTQAEAVASLATAEQQQQRLQALEQLAGGMRNYLHDLHQQLLQLLALLEAQLDYDEDEFESQSLDLLLLENSRERLQQMLGTYRLFEQHRSGLKLVLLGAVNAGKSSFFNLLLRRQRALVSAQEGTTRDFLEAELRFCDRRLHLYDTAGLRQSDDLLERQGIAWSEKLVEQADLLLLVVDACKGLSADLERYIARLPAERWIGLWNKSDLAAALPPPPGWLAISCLNSNGLENFYRQLESVLPPLPLQEGVFPLNVRQYNMLNETLTAMDETISLIKTGISMDLVVEPLRYACDHLGEVTGSKARSDLLDDIFANFCLGK